MRVLDMTKSEKFIKDLHELLDKYGAEITADDHWGGYAECGRDVRMTVEFMDCDDVDLGARIDFNRHEGRKGQQCGTKNKRSEKKMDAAKVKESVQRISGYYLRFEEAKADYEAQVKAELELLSIKKWNLSCSLKKWPEESSRERPKTSRRPGRLWQRIN